ncbi:ferrous iron transport protein B [Blautia massiliensis]|jgi:ferrous iron transport protein B|uniref:ferrous iron transport protein B n=1 Tax=Blautia TaxID=572511 RepID=UPI0010FF6F3B|nr:MULTISPECIES: ferrous iron transport protein B [Blautia]MCC2724850.1 ferrous iron transport protein B [Blautia sp. MSK22_86]NSF55879.1 ferrous iron transport protein B [Blautia massiliensis (ex Durand et al. 2017)]NSK70874.1 ferrous iron transport protein B [Blautia massiliensis (ex Durand et al. 2017)]QCU02546.1 ferrous iron transport protein B [Blautia sp. SC05B48]
MSVTIALAGNPNCGKTTMFNALTGANQYVGNWPGVTVEKKEGKLKNQKDVTVTDLPGIYSLSPYTLEEVVSRDYLLKEKPDVIIDLVDATNIERNLYLATQLLEIGIPVVIALNMVDLLKKNNIHINVKGLSSALGCPIVETSALKGTGLKEVVDEAIKCANQHRVPSKQMEFPKAVEKAVNEIEGLVPANISEENRRWYAVKLLERDSKVKEGLNLPVSAQSRIEEIASELEKAEDDDTESIVTDGRYQYIQKVVSANVKRSGNKMTVSDKIDRIVTNRILGLPIFILTMFIVYYVSVTTVGTMVTDWTNDSFVGTIQSVVSDGLGNAGVADWLVSLVSDGIIGGLGAVLGFVPQMAILFLFLSILEDCGYMVRIAFVMDRVFRHFGLSGKSFIPLLISSGCGIPGIMASKTIEADNDRRLTIMTATFIPCGAKLPVIALMGGIMTAYATGDYVAAGFITPLMYFIGVIAVLVSAIILKKTKPFSGKPAPFVMELPQYHIPSVKTVLLHVWERLKGFIIKAGTILFLATVIMWILSSIGNTGSGIGFVEDSNDSIMAILGGILAPIFAPLGFGKWQPVAASISGFSAKESIVSTMGVLANVAGDDAEDTMIVGAAIKAWFPTAVAAFSFLLFNLLDSPCLAAISTMAHEMQSRKWFWFAILFQNIFAYVVTLCVYQIGLVVTGAGSFGIGTIVALILVAILLFLLFRPDPYKNQNDVTKRSVQAAE